jgi:diguanylate cyclase
VPRTTPLYISVNVSARQFRDPGFVGGVRHVLATSGLAPSALMLELTESVLLRRDERIHSDLMDLKVIGVKLAIDDFGTGYSSLSYLQRFPINVLKVHHSFVHKIAPDQRDVPLLSAMINIGKSLNMRVIAEGVETRSQLEFLRHHDCNEAQGYYISHPVGAEQAGKLVEASIRESVAHQ